MIINVLRIDTIENYQSDDFFQLRICSNKQELTISFPDMKLSIREIENVNTKLAEKLNEIKNGGDPFITSTGLKAFVEITLNKKEDNV